MPPLTRRDALRWCAATTVIAAGCSGTDEPETSVESPRETTATTGQPSFETPLPESTLDAVDGQWPSYGFDATNTGNAPSVRGPSERPNVQWHADVPVGTGVPVVGRETVVVPTSDEAVVALDATDGAEQWRRDFSGMYLRSPAVADDLVVAAGDSLRAFTVADGDERWSYGSFDEVFGGVTVQEGTAYVPANEAVHAVDATAGERQWHTAFPDVGSTHGPVAVGDDAVVVQASGAGFTGLVALDPASGEERWRTGFDGDLSVPRLAGDVIYVGVERAYTDPYEDETVYAVDVATGDVTPLFRTPGRLPPALAVTDERLIVCERVDHPPDGPATESHTEIETDPDRTPGSSDEGEPSHVYALGRDGTEQWRTTIADESERGIGWNLSTPAVVDGVVFLVLSSGRVVALDATSGDERWRVWPRDFRTDVVGPAVTDGVVFAGGDDGVVALA